MMNGEDKRKAPNIKWKPPTQSQAEDEHEDVEEAFWFNFFLLQRELVL